MCGIEYDVGVEVSYALYGERGPFGNFRQLVVVVFGDCHVSRAELPHDAVTVSFRPVTC